MARSRTLADIRQEIRERGDLLEVRHSDAELNRNINQSVAELYDLLVSVNQDYYLSSEDVSVSSGTATYALPATFYKVVGVDVLDGSFWRMMRRYHFAERHQFQDSGTDKVTTFYRVMGDNLRLRPTPTWNGTVRLWYIPAVTELVDDDDSFDGIQGWEEFVVLDCIIKAKVKDEEGAEHIIHQKNMVDRRIRANAPDRDAGQPDRVRDSESEIDLYPWPWPYRSHSP